MPARTDTRSSLGALLKEWRGVRGMSQMDLALSAQVSTRHVSFVETGRSQPTREMVLRLSEALEVPLRERNGLLLAAGYAPGYSETCMDDASMAPVRHALERVLARHAPYPAFVLDAAWHIIQTNDTHPGIGALFVEDPASLAAMGDRPNVLRMIVHPKIMRGRLMNWRVVVRVLGHKLRRQLRVPEPDAALVALHEELVSDPEVAAAIDGPPPRDAGVLVPMELLVDGVRYAWFSTIATIGTPQDVTLEELRLETMWPADDETERALSRLIE